MATATLSKPVKTAATKPALQALSAAVHTSASRQARVQDIPCALPRFTFRPQEELLTQVMAYFQRLAANATACGALQITVLPSASYIAEFLGVELRIVVQALTTLEELGYHCEYEANDSPILLSDFLAVA